MPAHGLEPPGDGEGGVAPLEAPHVGHEVHGHDLGREGAVGGDDLDPGAGRGDHLGRLEPRVVAGVVVDQHVGAGPRVARQDVPGRDHEVVALRQHLGVGQAAGGDDHLVGLVGEHGLGVGEGVEAKAHAPLLALAMRQATMEIISRRRSLCAVRRIWPPGSSAASRTVTACPRSAATRAASRPAGPAPTTVTRAALAARRDGVGQLELAPGGGVVDAERRAPLVDAVEAVVRADAGPDVVLPPLEDLPRRCAGRPCARASCPPCRACPRRWRGARWRGRGSRGVEGREPGRGPDLAREVEVRGGGHALDRDHVGEAGVRVDVAAHDVEEVHEPAVPQRREISSPSARVRPPGRSSSPV